MWLCVWWGGGLSSVATETTAARPPPTLALSYSTTTTKKQLTKKGAPLSNDLNCGVVYFNGASPGGPAAWLLAETVERQLRYADDADFVHNTRVWPRLTNPEHMAWDQALFTDALASALLGAPAFYSSWAFQGFCLFCLLCLLSPGCRGVRALNHTQQPHTIKQQRPSASAAGAAA